MDMREDFYPRCQFDYYQVALIGVRDLPLFFNTSFEMSNDTLIVRTRVGHYRNLYDIDKLEIRTVLNMLINLVTGMVQCYNYYIFPEMYKIDGNSVYLSQNGSCVRCRFVPQSCEKKVTFAEVMNALKPRLIELIDKDEVCYLERAMNLIGKNHIGTQYAINQIKRLVKDVAL